MVQELLQRGSEVRVMTRSEAKAAALPADVEGVVGDTTQPETLHSAMQGADAVFLITPLAPDEISQGLAAVEAAKQARVKNLVYMSVHKVEGAVHIPHFATKLPIEYAVRNFGADWTIIRPNNFYQNDSWLKEAITRYGVYPQPLGEVGVNRVDVRDIAEIVAISITATGHSGQTYSAVGPEALTGEQTAEIYSHVLRRPVRYIGDDLEGWAAAAARDMPPWLVMDLKVMYDHFLRHGFRATAAEVSTFEGLLGHELRSFEAFVRESFT